MTQLRVVRVRAMAALASALFLRGAEAQDPHAPAEGHGLYLRCELANEAAAPHRVEVDLPLTSIAQGSRLSGSIELPPPLPPVELLQFLPLATLDQRLIRDDTGGSPAALELAIEGPTQSYRRCLAAGDRTRDRLDSLIASWRLVTVGDADLGALRRRFADEPNRPPVLRVETAQEVVTIPAQAGRSAYVSALDRTVRVVDFYPHYVRDPENGQPRNQSAERRNPAVQFELIGAKGRERQWAFTRFPGFKMAVGAAEPARFILDCPVHADRPAPDILLVSTGARGEVWIRDGRTITAAVLRPGTPLSIPHSRYTFLVTRFLPSARLIEEYLPTADMKQGVTVMQVAAPDESGGRTPLWVVLGHPRVLETPAGPLTLALERRPMSHAGEVHRSHQP